VAGITSLAGLSVILLLFQLVVMLACFNTVVNSQRYEFSVMDQIKSELYRFPSQSVKTLAFIGQLRDAPEVRTNIREFPIIDSIRMKMLGESEPWIWQTLVAHAGIPLDVIRATEPMRVRQSQPPVSQGPNYDAYVIHDTLVIDFTR